MGSRFNTKIKPILKYIGTIGAALMSVAYIAIVLIMVFGMSLNTDFTQSIIFAFVNAVMGLIIMQFLKIQGIDLAKEIEENKAILERYYNMKTKDKKSRSIKYFWTTSLIKDILVRGITLAASTLCIIYIVVAGTQNYTWLLLALVNLIMFGCYGLLALVKSYDFFNESHIPYIKEKINEADEEKRKAEFEAAERAAKEREETIEAEVKRRMEKILAMDEKGSLNERNVVLATDSGTNLLESSDSVGNPCDIGESMVLECGNINNTVLGGTVHTCNGTSNCSCVSTEENIQRQEKEKE